MVSTSERKEEQSGLELQVLSPDSRAGTESPQLSLSLGFSEPLDNLMVVLLCKLSPSAWPGFLKYEH